MQFAGSSISCFAAALLMMMRLCPPLAQSEN